MNGVRTHKWWLALITQGSCKSNYHTRGGSRICDYRSVFPFSGHAIARFVVLQVKISPLIHNIKRNIYIICKVYTHISNWPKFESILSSNKKKYRQLYCFFPLFRSCNRAIRSPSGQDISTNAQYLFILFYFL